MNNIFLRLPMLSLAAALALAACGKQEAPAPAAAPPAATAPAAPATAAAPAMAPTSVASVMLGNAIGNDGKIAAPSTTFASKDTIYAVVSTTSTGQTNDTVTAKWTFGADAQLVNQTNQAIAGSGPATTTFHISKPDGLPAGKYKIEISVDNKVQSTSDFEVK